MRGVREPELFKRDGGLAAVRRRPSVKIDHGIGVLVCNCSAAFTLLTVVTPTLSLPLSGGEKRARAAFAVLPLKGGGSRGGSPAAIRDVDVWRYSRGAFLTPKPGRGNIGALADRLELEPDHR